MVGSNTHSVYVIVGTLMASAYNFTNVYFLCSTTEPKCLTSEP
jgi:hypothetical protein